MKLSNYVENMSVLDKYLTRRMGGEFGLFRLTRILDSKDKYETIFLHQLQATLYKGIHIHEIK